MLAASNCVRLTFRPEEDGTGQLAVEVSADGFGGSSQAWVSSGQLIEFASTLETFPLSRDMSPLLQGGFWNAQSPDQLTQTHVRLTAYPIGVRGPVGVQVYLARPLWDTDRPESQAIVQVEIRTTYQALRSFAQQLRQLAQGTMPSAELSGVVH
jgi:hypothetical protein